MTRVLGVLGMMASFGILMFLVGKTDNELVKVIGYATAAIMCMLALIDRRLEEMKKK